MMTKQGWHLTGLLVGGMTIACAPCDEGGDASCPAPGVTVGEGTGGEDTGAAGTQATAGLDDGSGSQGGDGEDSGDGDHGDGDHGDDDHGDGDDHGDDSVWCLDEDGDGFGDPDHCQTSDEPPPGHVDNDDDCDDTNPYVFLGSAPNDDPAACMKDQDDDDWGDHDPPEGVEPGTDCDDLSAATFPGAAPSDDPFACMKDRDDDDWGDHDPPEGVEPGTDCDDTDAFAFPGAAEHEQPGLCTLDADGDGWGDANPGQGVVAGSDCYDANPALSPDALQLTAFVAPGEGMVNATSIATVDPIDAGMLAVATVTDPAGFDPGYAISTATLDAQGQVVVNDLGSVALLSLEYGGVCVSQATVLDSMAASYGLPGDILCGLEFAGDGLLYGLDHDDNLLAFDPLTGQLIDTTPVETMGVPLNINVCDMAYDCVEDRLLVANGVNNTIYEIDPATAVAQPVKDLEDSFGGPWQAVGLEYDPVERRAYLAVDAALYRVQLAGAAPPVFIGALAQPVANLQNLPICS